MATAKRQNPVELTVNEDGTLTALWPVRRWRFLFSDGRTIDVYAMRDDSDLRDAVLAYAKAERIEGVARIEEVQK